MLLAQYLRVSTSRQENEQTTENQAMAIKEFADKNGHTIVKEYRDEGWSGTLLARPALDELRMDASKKLWDGVIMYDPDRLARKYSFQELVSDELQEKGIPILYVTTPPVRDESDKLLYGVKGLFAEYERFRIAERFRLGKLRNARAGLMVTSHAPFGYRWIPKVGSTHGYYEINEQEATVVKMMFEWIAKEGMTMRQVIRRLKELAIRPRKNEDGVWTTSTLTNLFRNGTYCGKAHYNKTTAVVPVKPIKLEKYKKVKKSSRKFKPMEDWIEIPCPAIISEELFLATQEQLRKNYGLSNRNKKYEYLLAEKIRCVCGSSRTGTAAQLGKHLYYRCSEYVNSFPLPRGCHEKGVNARIADKLVWDEVVRFMSSPDLIKKQVERFSQQVGQGNQYKQQVATLELEINKLAQEEGRYISAFGSQLITLEKLGEMVKTVREKKTGLEGQVKHLQSQTEQADCVLPGNLNIESFCVKVNSALHNLCFERKRAILREIVDKIVANQKELHVYGYLPLIEKEETENVEFWSECRNCGPCQCRKVYFVQRSS